MGAGSGGFNTLLLLLLPKKSLPTLLQLLSPHTKAPSGLMTSLA